MQRTHRITQHLIDKHKDIAWVDVWHLADDIFNMSLLASKTYFKCYYCSRHQVKVLGFKDDLRIEKAIEVCRLLHRMGLPLDHFNMHGSTIWNTEQLREAIIEDE